MQIKKKVSEVWQCSSNYADVMEDALLRQYEQINGKLFIGASRIR
jgi:hypothetical protein